MPQNSAKVFGVVFLLASIFGLGYFIDRSQSLYLISIFSIGFTSYYFLISKTKISIKEVLIVGIIARLLLSAASPALSDDFYRFAFDGQQIVKGDNPYKVLPAQLENKSDYELRLMENMNSPNYYTVYPPINQICFSMPAFVAKENISIYIFCLRILIVLFEILLALLLLKMLNYFKKDLKLFAWYFLNPLVIMELTGNLHFEGVTMFFFLLAIWLLVQGKWWQSAIVYACAIGTKLIPIMLLPFFIKRIRMKVVRYYLVVAISLIILFIPFIDNELIQNFMSSVNLYFNDFMFNGSIFKLLDASIVPFVKGEYAIHLLGKILPLIIVISIFSMVLKSKSEKWDNFLEQSMFALLIYYALASIVHPWYVINLLVLSLFTRYKFPIVWSGLVVLSYSAYSVCPIGNCAEVLENNWLIAAEYLILFGMLFYERWKLKNDGQIQTV